MELVERLRCYLFPAGEQRARAVRAVRIAERGEMRMSPGAKWVPFTADETVDGVHSSFCWNARIGAGRFGFTTVTDAYESGSGRLVVKLGGVIPAMKITGPDADRGELQRYLASILFCPAALLHNTAIELTAISDSTVRLRDREDSTGATVDFEVGPDGRPVCCRAMRPRAVGKQLVLTPWIATCRDSREWEGMRVATSLQVAWRLPEEEFVYFRSEVVSLAAQ